MASRRKAAPTRKAESERDRRLPAVAGRGDRDLEAAGRGLSWRDRGSGAHRSVFQSDPAAWEADPVAARAARDGDGASLVDTAGPRRGEIGRASCRERV